MAQKAKNGSNQAVRPPKSGRFPNDQREVLSRRVDRRATPEPADEWSRDFVSSLGAWNEEIERPQVPKKRIRSSEEPEKLQ